MFTTPWAIFALVSVPVVVGIYLFRTRTRRRVVSGLFLWSDQTQSRQGGRRIETLQFPLLLLLELLILTLLAIAAAGPHLQWNTAGRPTVIILDDSYSMQAKVRETDGTVRTMKQRAAEELERFLAKEAGYPVQFILAGNSASLLSGFARNSTEARLTLENWTANAPTAAMDAAISLAARTAISGAKILVLTDHAPNEELAVGKIRWHSFGQPLANLAIVHASRVFQADKDRILVEIANFATKEERLQLSLFDTTGNRILQKIDQPIHPGETLSFRFSLDGGTTGGPANFPVELRLTDDALDIDNSFTLLPPVHRPVRVTISGVPDELRLSLQRAVETSGLAEFVTENPDLRFTGGETEETPYSSQHAWNCRLFSERDDSKVQSFLGPFVVDRGNRLTSGLSLDGVVWAASTSAPMGGLPVISAGNVPLLTEQVLRGGSRELRLQVSERLSTLTLSPDWPILIWNILRLRSEHLHGIPANNIRLGSEAVFIAASNDKTLEIKGPDNAIQRQPVRGLRTSLPAARCGVYEVKAESGTYLFSVGAFSSGESNLQSMRPGIFGGWLDEETIRADYRSLVWPLLLASLVLLVLHLILTARSYAVRE
ncbi:MAG: VWA domain-containing protein [Planctomycetaceae bacterium]|nr:VWA domain-containing protein [Planctomycetaceae bacterium]